MEFLKRLFGRSAPAPEAVRRPRELTPRELMIAQVAGTHRAWFPAHNPGQEAPEEAVTYWIEKLTDSSLQDHELALLVADNKARNALLGKTWP